MHKLRLISVGLGALALVGAAVAQFDGPAPLAWRFLQPTRVPPGGAPLANGDLLYQAIGGRIYCIDRNSGNKLWQYPQLDPIDGAFRQSPLLAGGSLLATGDNSILYAIDPETGAAKWSQRLPVAPLGFAVIVGDAYVTALSDNSLIALKVSDGTPLWGTTADTNVFKVFDGLTGRIAASGGDVLYFTGHNELVALNVVRRAPDWHLSFDQLPTNPIPTVTKEAIYVNSGPYLIAVNPATGTARWEVDTRMQLSQTPVASTNGILVVSDDGHAQVYDPLSRRGILRDDKGQVAPLDLGSQAIMTPTAVGSDFVVLTANGAINLIDPTKSSVQWAYVIKPLVETANASARNQNGRGGPGGAPGGPGGPGGGGFGGGGGGFGGGGAGGAGGGFGGGQNGGPGGLGGQTRPTKITYIQAAAPAVLDGQTLIVPARDGSILAFDKTLGIDLTPPAVEMTFPNPGDQVSGQPPLILVFKVTDDDSGLRRDSIKVAINGEAADYTLDKEDQVIVQFSLTGKNHPLADGRKEIVVTASDWMGNVIHKSFSLSIDNALRPIVIPGSPQNGQNGQPGGKGGGGFGGGGGGVGGGD